MTAHPRAVYSFMTLVAVGLILVVLNIFQTARVSQAQDQQRCASLTQVAAIPVPTPIAGNPSREWEARYEAIQRSRARHLGCKP